MRDKEKGHVELYRRDTQEKQFVTIDDLAKTIEKMLYDVQKNIYDKHRTFTLEHTSKADNYEDFKTLVEK
jgi:prolyl-tRNA synthetase